MDGDLEQLMVLREMTRTTGILHEAQVLQLKYYPLILTHATRSEFHYDFENAIVIFNLKETKGSKPKQWTKRMETLAEYTQTLLGKEYTIQVKLKGELQFVSKGDINVRREARRKLLSPKGAGKPSKVAKGK